jgi:hypothetical protein
MKRTALGVQMHSGWGVLIAVADDTASIEVLERQRIVIADENTPGAIQPYHHAATLKPAQAEKHISDCAVISGRLAFEAVANVVRELDSRRYRVAACAVLLASGRPLPSLEKILAAHLLIHTAEGEFFRTAVRNACEALRISVTAFPERELDTRAQTMFGNRANRVKAQIANLGRAIGPPWTKDHKTAALAAAVVLSMETASASL